MLTAISAIIVFSLLITVHEFGHFITAKKAGITVHEFSIGMGKAIWQKMKNGTVYSIRILPIGGFCKMEGEDGDSADDGAFCNKSAWKRFTVLFAGAFMNIVTGFVLFVILISLSSPIASTSVGEILPDYPFATAGIQVGDRIVRLEGENYSTNVNLYSDISFFKFRNGNDGANITFERDGERFTKYIEQKKDEKTGSFIYGFVPMAEEQGVISTIKNAFYQSVFTVKMVIESFVMLITGQVPMSDMAGPVGIVKEIGSAAKMGILNVINLAALLSINLGVANLLPIPALDGGRILILLIEKIRRKPLKAEHEGMIHFIGFALLMILMVFVTFSDITRLFK